MKRIVHFVHIRAATEKVYRALTTEEGLAGWWSTAVRVRPGGGVMSFRFTGDFNPDMEPTELEPNRRVEWRCVGGHDNWRDSTFSFDLRDAGGGAELLFVQTYERELSDEVYGAYNFNWGYYLGSLKRLCETGEGTPFTSP
jgi:uncharacterized protein YndB with AHSA1/START domain